MLPSNLGHTFIRSNVVCTKKRKSHGTEYMRRNHITLCGNIYDQDLEVKIWGVFAGISSLRILIG